MKYINKLQPLLLPICAVIGVILANIIWDLSLSLFLKQTLFFDYLLLQFFRWAWLLLTALPIFVISTLIVQYYSIEAIFKNSCIFIILTIFLSLIARGIFIAVSILLNKILPVGIFYWLTLYVLPIIGILIEPLFAPLLLWLVIASGFPVKRSQYIVPLSHGMQLLLIFCTVAFVFYWMVVIFQLSLSKFSMFKIQISLAVLAGCFIYDRVQYADIYQANKFTKLRVIMVIALLVVTIVMSVLSANYMVQVYNGKYIANLIIQIFVNGLMMACLTQLWMRKILYRF
ncbi:MAG: hypothetical protein ACRCXK_08825 [Wohlfahrtiimonas sp.]